MGMSSRSYAVIEVPKLKEEEWPEVRKLKASRNTGWEYFGNLVKTVYKEVGEEKTCQLISKFMAENAQIYVKAGMKGLELRVMTHWRWQAT